MCRDLQGRPYRLEAVLGGRDFIFHNDADKLVFRAQMAASIFTLLLLVIAFFTAQEMFGTTAGFVALGLLIFDPTLLAHGALVTTDAAQACFLLASIYAFYRYVKAPSVVPAGAHRTRRRLGSGVQTQRCARHSNAADSCHPLSYSVSESRRKAIRSPPIRQEGSSVCCGSYCYLRIASRYSVGRLRLSLLSARKTDCS